LLLLRGIIAGRTAELPNCRTAELPNCRTAELPNCRTAELPNCRIDGYFLALLKQTRGFCHLSKLNQFHQNRNGNFLSHKVLAVLNLKSCS
jgi:hypothetical protein